MQKARQEGWRGHKKSGEGSGGEGFESHPAVAAGPALHSPSQELPIHLVLGASCAVPPSAPDAQDGDAGGTFFNTEVVQAGGSEAGEPWTPPQSPRDMRILELLTVGTVPVVRVLSPSPNTMLGQNNCPQIFVKPMNEYMVCTLKINQQNSPYPQTKEEKLRDHLNKFGKNA